MNDGDWVCCDPQCGNVNFARRTSCNRCGKEKATIPSRKKLGHEIGKAAAEKSRGLFSADDWQCGRCGNVNWARRQQCNMCNAPKFGEVEERTGLGGGYNERENVEYIERDESDGEYDDFGRKKKKFRGNEEEPTKSKSPPVKATLPVVEKVIPKNNEEEEDEDDDDADLSKYDLSGWGDDESDKEQDKNSRSKSHSPASSRSSRSSRSRSSSRSSQSSRSTSPSTSSDSGKLSRRKRTHSRSRSQSSEHKREKKRDRSRSPLHISSSRSRDRSQSSSPVSRKR